MTTALMSRSKAIKALDSAKAGLKRVREKGHELAETVVQTAEVGMGALVMGGIQGRFGDVSVGPIPVSLGSGLVLHAAAFAGVGRAGGGKHLHSLGDGCLAAYLTTLGTGIGADLRKKALSSGMAGDYSDPSGNAGGGVLNDQEQAALSDTL